MIESGWKTHRPIGTPARQWLATALLALPVAAFAQTGTAPALVTVAADGQVMVEPDTLSATAGSGTLRWQLQTPGYEFALPTGVVLNGYTCATSRDKLSVSCTASAYKKGKVGYSILVVAKGTSLTPVSSDVRFIQNN